MKLWRFEFDRPVESIIATVDGFESVSARAAQIEPNLEHHPFAIIIDGSRWRLSVETALLGDNKPIQKILILDSPTIARSFSVLDRRNLVDCLARVDRSDIAQFTTKLSEVLGPEFSIALIDCLAKRLVLARDPIGSRPLFWRRVGRSVFFSSSRQDLAHAGAPPPINEAAVALLLSSSTDVWSRHELLDGVQRVPHAGVTLISSESARSDLWWTPQLWRGPNRQEDQAQTTQQVRQLLEDAVATRIGASERIGAHVSGGIDSTGVAALGARQLKHDGRALVGAYAWAPPVSDAFPDMGWSDERRRIEAFATSESAPMRFGGATSEDFVTFLARPIEFEGTADLADEMPILKMAQADGVEIMLSGWGGDEAFSNHGYGYLAYLLASFQWDRAIHWMRAQLRTLRKIGPLASTLWWQGVHPMLPDAIYRLVDPFDIKRAHPSLMSDHLRKQHGAAIRETRHAFRVTPRLSETMYRQFLVGHITHRIETWDTWSRQHGFQYTYPLTDRRLIERLLSLPPEAHFPNEVSRGLAKTTLADVLPPGVTKHDAANEASRTAVRTDAWRRLGQMHHEGAFQADCPWIDMKRFRERLANPADQTSGAGVIAFLQLFNAVRVWHLWARQEGLEPSGTDEQT